MFGLRGSGQGPQWDPDNDPIPTASEAEWMGQLQQGVYEQIASDLKADNPDIDVRAVGIRYQARRVPLFSLKDLEAVGLEDYTESIFDGVDKLIARLAAEEHCHGTRFVLTGYSQGALSIHIALLQMASYNPGLLERIDNVGLFSDPARTADGEELVWSSADSPANWFVTTSSGVFSSFLLTAQEGLSGPLPSTVANKTVSVCRMFDMVCEIAPLANPLPHLSYNSDDTTAVGAWIADRVLNGGSLRGAVEVSSRAGASTTHMSTQLKEIEEPPAE